MDYSKEQIQKLIPEKLADLDEHQVALANHVKDCYICMNFMENASQLCKNHYKETKSYLTDVSKG